MGGYAEQIARTRSPAALTLGVAVVLVKLVGALVAVALSRAWSGLRRLLVLGAGAVGSAVLVVYGGLLVGVGALVLSHVITPDGAVDRHVLTWPVAF